MSLMPKPIINLPYFLNITKTTYHSGLYILYAKYDLYVEKHDGKKAANFILINGLLGLYLLAGSG